MSSTPEVTPTTMANTAPEDSGHRPPAKPGWRRWLSSSANESESADEDKPYRARATMGILSDRETDEVPGKWQ